MLLDRLLYLYVLQHIVMITCKPATCKFDSTKGGNMKKLIAAALLLFSSQLFAAGPYDGIWSIAPYGYATVSERDGVLVIVSVYNADYGGIWTASQGMRVNNMARMTQIVGIGQSVYDLVIESDTTAKITQVSCSVPISSGYYCQFPNGYVLYATKVW